MAKDFERFARDLKALQKEFKGYLNGKFPKIVGEHMKETVDVAWQKEGFTDSQGSFKKWKARKKEVSGRKLLVGKGSGILRRSIVVYATAKRVRVGTPIKYAQIHNEGGIIRQRFMSRPKNKNKAPKLVERTIEIPQRQFMGSSKILFDKIKAELDKKLGSLSKK